MSTIADNLSLPDIRLLAAEAARSRRIMKDLSTRAEAEDPFAILR